MNYVSIYCEMVKRAQSRQIEGYSEAHHIVPRCLGGEDSTANIARLTAREHYLAHLLLVKIYPRHTKLAFAAHMLTLDRYGHRVGNRKYEWLRKRHAKAMGELKKGNTYTLGKKWSAETRAKMSASQRGHGRGKGRTFSQESKAKISASNKGKPKSLSHCESLSKTANKRAAALPPYTDGSVRVPGVVQRSNGMFVARGRVKGVRVYLGFFPTSQEAANAVKQCSLS